MAEYTGQNLLVNWIWSGGTASLSGDFRNVNWQPAVDMADATAGSDTHRARIATIKDATATVTLLAQTDGTALAAALASGNAGTLLIQPEGTATNKPKITFPSICAGAQFTYPYNDVVSITCTFNGNGAYTVAAN